MAQSLKPLHKQELDQQGGRAINFRIAQVVGQSVGRHSKGVAGPFRQLHKELLLLNPS